MKQMKKKSGEKRCTWALVAQAGVIFGIISLFCYEIAEISINSFFISMVDDGWMNARDASVVLSFGGLGLFMCGRFAGSWIMRYIRAEKVLFVCAIERWSARILVVLIWAFCH